MPLLSGRQLSQVSSLLLFRRRWDFRHNELKGFFLSGVPHLPLNPWTSGVSFLCDRPEPEDEDEYDTLQGRRGWGCC